MFDSLDSFLTCAYINRQKEIIECDGQCFGIYKKCFLRNTKLEDSLGYSCNSNFGYSVMIEYDYKKLLKIFPNLIFKEENK